MTKIDFHWTDEPPMLDVEVPRVPVEGETVIGPDDTGAWQVASVVYNYENGMAFAPRVVVWLRREE
jgi:hypothetical protein